MERLIYISKRIFVIIMNTILLIFWGYLKVTWKTCLGHLKILINYKSAINHDGWNYIWNKSLHKFPTMKLPEYLAYFQRVADLMPGRFLTITWTLVLSFVRSCCVVINAPCQMVRCEIKTVLYSMKRGFISVALYVTSFLRV